MISISKNVYTDKLDDIVNEYNNTYHTAIKMKPIDVKDNTYTNTDKEINNKDPKFKVGDRVKQEGKGLKISAPKQMLKRLLIALAQIKAGNNSESLLNEIRQIVYSLYRSKEITKKVYNNIINSIKV